MESEPWFVGKKSDSTIYNGDTKTKCLDVLEELDV